MMRLAAKVRIRALEPWKIGKGLVNRRHPVLAHIVPVRRCNLACTYCPGTRFEDYTPDDLRREFDRPKTCARYCTIACVQIIGLFDNWRSPQTGDPYVSQRAEPAPTVPVGAGSEPQHQQV